MLNSERELSKQGGGPSGSSSIQPAKIRRCSLGNGGAATVVDVEEGLSASPSTPFHSLHQESGSTNEINFMCNFSKNMICSFQFSGNESNPACDAMLKLRYNAIFHFRMFLASSFSIYIYYISSKIDKLFNRLQLL